MKRLHPNRGQAAVAAAVLAAAVLAVAIGSGCRNSSNALDNPFLAPDRVPPPATRVIAPGTAQPYYPGDALPSMQGSKSPDAGAAVVAETTPNSTSPPTNQLAVGDEPAVAVPADDNGLRFPLASPLPVVPSQPIAAPQMAAATPSPAPSTVTHAVYNEVDPYRVTPIQLVDSPSGGPWRPPQLPHSASPQFAAQQTAAAAMQIAPPATVAAAAQQHDVPSLPPPPVPAFPAMPVVLRSVPSPAMGPAYFAPPRIRFPGAIVSAAPATISPATATGGVLQPVQVTALPLEYAGAVLQPPPASSADGFRPRGSVR